MLTFAFALASCSAFASSPLPAQQPAASQQPGWNLRWRKSPKVAPRPVHIPREDVFSDPLGQQVVAPVGFQQPAVTTARLRTEHSVQQAAHNEPASGTPTANYRSGASAADARPTRVAQPVDLFNNPFAGRTDRSPLPTVAGSPAPPRSLPAAAPTRPASAYPIDIDRRANTVGQPRLAMAPSPQTDGAPPSSGFQLPMPSREATGPAAEDLPSNALRGDSIPEMPLPDAPQSPNPVPGNPDTVPVPEPKLPAPDSGPTMRDLLNDSDQMSPKDAAPDVTADAPQPKRGSDDAKTADSPSDKTGPAKDGLGEQLYENPFDEFRQGRGDAATGQGGQAAPSAVSPQPWDTDMAKVEELSCEDFRERIARETIDRISLDPSPPFRPGLFTPKDYDKYRAEFESRQKSRPWSSTEGRVIGTGRLINLAYEQVIIETANGQRQRLPVNRLSEGDLGYLSENWGLPKECLIEQVAFVPRSWAPLTMTWKASNICSKPRYFEEVNLERYGHTAGPWLQPVVSSAHFFANIAVLPYKMGVHPPNECQYALGYYRPGSCAPWIVPPVPISARGALTQAAVMTGTFWLIP